MGRCAIRIPLGIAETQASNLRRSSQALRSPTFWSQLGVASVTGPEIMSGLGAFRTRRYRARLRPGFFLGCGCVRIQESRSLARR